MHKLVVIFFLVLACNTQEKTNPLISNRQIVQKPDLKSKEADSVIHFDASSSINFIPEIPDSLWGCGQVFTYDTTNTDDTITRNKFIFISDYQYAIIRINGINIPLQIDTVFSSHPFRLKNKYVFIGKGIRVFFHTTVVKKVADEGSDEVIYENGSMEISTSSYKRMIKVKGSSGC